MIKGVRLYPQIPTRGNGEAQSESETLSIAGGAGEEGKRWD